MNIKNFYSEYFRDEFIRKVVFSNLNNNYNVPKPILFKDKKFFNKNLVLKSLIKHTDKTIYADISSYSNIADASTDNDDLRNVDRLFFDFDFEKNDKVIPIKDKREKAIKDKDFDLFYNCQLELQELIFNDDLLLKPFNDMVTVTNYFREKHNLKPFVIFSGSAGFHVIYFLDQPVNFNSFTINSNGKTQKYQIMNEIMAEILDFFNKSCNLSTVDTAVKDAITRKQRVPYSLNQKSNLKCVPLGDCTNYNDAMDIIKNFDGSIIDFNLDKYKCPAEFTDFLFLYKDKIIEHNKLCATVSDANKYYQVNNRKFTHSGKVSNVDGVFSDCRELFKLIGGEVVKDYGKYLSCRCICKGHDDNIASARVYEDNYYCAGCGSRLNYFGILKEFYDLKSDDAVKNKMREIRNKTS